MSIGENSDGARELAEKDTSVVVARHDAGRVQPPRRVSFAA